MSTETPAVDEFRTVTIPTAHSSKQTLKLIADERFPDRVIHVVIEGHDGTLVAHDAPRDELIAALAELTGEPA